MIGAFVVLAVALTLGALLGSLHPPRKPEAKAAFAFMDADGRPSVFRLPTDEAERQRMMMFIIAGGAILTWMAVKRLVKPATPSDPILAGLPPDVVARIEAKRRWARRPAFLAAQAAAHARSMRLPPTS